MNVLSFPSTLASALGWHKQWEWLVAARKALILVGIIGFLLGLGVAFVVPTEFKVTLTLEPWSGDAPQLSGNLAAIASKFGVQPNVENSPLDLFTKVLQSDTLLRTLIRTPLDPPFPDSASWAQGTLLAYYHVDSQPTARALSKAVNRLNDDLDVSSDIPSGTVGVTLTLKDRWLVLPAARQLVDLANRYLESLNSETHRAERVFLEGKVTDAQAALNAAEDSLQRFEDSNRTFSQTSRLKVKEDRLVRHVQLAEQQYLTLAQQLSDARLAEAQNTPVLVMADPGVVPPPPGLAHRVLVALGIAAIVVLGWIGWTSLQGLEQTRQSSGASH